MKKLMILGVLFLSSVTFFTSCSSTEVSPADETSALSDFLFLASNHDSTGTKTGGKHNVTAIDVATLPAAITSYITTTYAGATINAAGTLTDGSYVVHITKADATVAGLRFTAAGVFVSEKAHKAPHTHIEVSALPAAITSYISTNYVGSTVEKAAVNTDGTYVAVVLKADATRVGVAFTAAGVFTGEVTVKARKEGGKKGSHKKG
jgi:hypothetical protein